MKQLISLSFCLFIFVNLSSCSQTNEEEIKEGISAANQALTERRCDAALDILGGIGYQGKNPRYLQVYASAWGCKANFSEITFFASDLPNITVGTSSLFGALSTLTTSSDFTTVSDSIYQNLQNGIDALLFAGDINQSSHENRLGEFSFSEVNNMNVQALYMIIVQMGRFFNFYGNSGAAGAKGTGVGASTCYLDYLGNALALASVGAGQTGLCTGAGQQHPDLEANIALKCQGIVLFNNFIDIVAIN